MILCERLRRWLGVIFWGLACRTITLASPFDSKLCLKYLNFDLCSVLCQGTRIKKLCVQIPKAFGCERRGVPPPQVSSVNQ
jgi:hypothetical protein